MKNFYKIFFFSILTLIVISGCADIKNDLAPAPETSIHRDGILNPDSPDFHGVLFANSQNGWQDCQQCHAVDYSGGITGIGCNTPNCHPTINVHQDGIIDTNSADFHGNFIASHGWDVQDCSTCHASDYSGGLVSPSCLTCHTYEGGPESCNTCHGDFNDPTRIAPPRALNGDTATTYVGVGAHTMHLYENDISDIPCSTCHVVPETFESAGHIDNDDIAEINFDGVAIVNDGSESIYDYSTATCSNTYCHGNFIYTKESAPDSLKFAFAEDQIVGNNLSVVWNQVDSTQAQCGSCHGLPPVGHIFVAANSCGRSVYCHSDVVDFDGNIFDPSKHINGEINVDGN